MKNNKGITLIALVITIIVLLVLSGTVISMITGEDGIIIQAQETKFKSELSSLKDEYMLFINNKKLESPTQFKEESVWASKNSLTYNTKTEENGNIENVLPSISKSLKDKIEIVKGKMLIKTQNEREVEWAEEIGVGVNPYEITEDGVLVSSNGNLQLIDENGTLELPDTITEIGEGAFAKVDGLKKIIIPGSVKIIEKNAFRGNITLEEVIIEEGVETIGSSAFQSCTNLLKIDFADSITTIGSSAMFGCNKIDNITLPSNLTKINMQLFYQCSNLKNITLPSNLETIEGSAFGFCTGLHEIKLPESLIQIGGSAFKNCNKLENIKIDSNNINFIYKNGILMNSDGTEIYFMSNIVLSSIDVLELPEGLKKYNNSINEYKNIKKIIIPKSLSEISLATIFPSTIGNIEIKEGNEYFSVENNCLYSFNKKRLFFCYSKDENITLNSPLEKIENNSFYGAINVKSIVLPDSLTSIGAQAFSDCKNLESLNIGKNVSIINPLFKYSNYNCIVNIDEENPNYMIEDNVLYSKDKKTIITVLYKIEGKFTMSSDVEYIGTNAFHNQSSMTEIELSKKIKKIDKSFNYCSGLTKIEIPSTVEEISTACFNNSTVTEIIINKKEGSISGAPWGCIQGIKAVKWNG